MLYSLRLPRRDVSVSQPPAPPLIMSFVTTRFQSSLRSIAPFTLTPKRILLFHARKKWVDNDAERPVHSDFLSLTLDR